METTRNRIAAIVGATLIDGTGRPPLEGTTVLVEGERISAVGPSGAVSVPPGAEHVNAAGQFLLPGLIDVHVHVSYPLHIPVPPKGDRTAYAAVVAARNLRSALQAGITTVRDVCGPRTNLALRTAVARGQLLGPRIFTAGKGICMTGGHGSDDPDAVHQVDGPEAVRRAVREERRAGVDLIKLLSSHRTDHPEFSQLEIDAGVDEAHRLGLRVAIHAANFASTRMAVRGGVDVIEHGSFIDEETAAAMAERGTRLVPTLWVKHDLAVRLEDWKSTPERFAWGDPVDLAESAAWFRRCVERLPETIRIAREHGVRIAAGTDFVFADHPWALLPEEIEFLTRLGIPPLEAIESATRIGAEVIGVEDELGTIEAGKLADLILVDRNPLDDIRALRNVGWVMQGGRIIPRSPEWDRRPIADPIVV